MVRKPTTSDPEQRQHEAERARRSSQLSAGGSMDTLKKQNQQSHESSRPAHGSSDGESAHGAIPRRGIEFEQGD